MRILLKTELKSGSMRRRHYNWAHGKKWSTYVMLNFMYFLTCSVKLVVLLI